MLLTFRRKPPHPDTIRLNFAEARAKAEGFMPRDMSLRQHLDKLINEDRKNVTKQTG